jgi:hypothetical protein
LRVISIIFGQSLTQRLAGGLQTIDRNGSRIEHDVYAINVSVSNTGSALPERANDVNSLVRSPFVIASPDRAKNGGRIISASIATVSEKRPVNLACDLSLDNITVRWDHLDPRSGFRVLILYTGMRELAPVASIAVVGMHRLNHVVLAPRMIENKFTPNYAFAGIIVVVTVIVAVKP